MLGNMLQGCQFATQKVTWNIGTWWHGHFFSKIIIRYHDHRPMFDHFPTKPRNSSVSLHNETLNKKLISLNNGIFGSTLSWILTPPENQDIPTESWWDWKMIHFPLRWPRSRGHSTIFEGCTPKTNMDTQNDALERVNSLLHKAICGVFVKFLGCRQCRPSKFLSCLK